MTDSYDVIVIGSGAGGGTLVHATGAVGQAVSCCSSAATGCPASRRTGSRRTCSSTAATCRRTPGTTRTARRSSPRCTTTSAARPSCTAPRCTGCARRTSASCSTTTASRRRGRSPTSEMEPYYTHGRAALPGARRARGGSDRAAGERPLPVPGGLARAAHPAAVRRPRRGRASPVPRALRRCCSTSATCPTASACAARTATDSRAWCTPSPTPR